MSVLPTAAIRWFAYVLALTGSVALFLHAQIASGFALLLGDRFDGLIQVALLEHWHNVMSGAEAWQRMSYFYPYRGTLGYNDGFLLYGLPYSLYRRLGTDPFLATELTTGTTRIVAFVTAELFLHRALRLPWPFALLGATLFTVSYNASLGANHAQLLTTCFAPLFAWLMWEAVRAAGQGSWWRASARASTAAVLMGAWLLTGYYMAWFMLFYCLCLTLLALVTRWRTSLAMLASVPRLAWFALGSTGLVAILAVTPFLIVYLPTARTTGAHDYFAVRDYGTQPLDLILIGDGNPLLSWMDAAIQGALRPGFPRYSEHTDGLTWLLLLLFGVAFVMLWRRRTEPAVRPIFLLALTAVLIWLLTLRVFTHSAWALVYFGVPGAKGLRVVVRYQLFMAGPVIAVVTWFLADLRGRVPNLVLAGLAFVLLAEQVTLNQPLALDRSAELAELASVPLPPSNCLSFYVSHARAGRLINEEIDGLYSHNVDAMLLAELFRLPTINGFSTFNPPDWDFNWPDRPDYRDRVRTYAKAHGLTKLCALDLQTRRWDTDPLR